MDNSLPESGLELVLDNRKLILAFALLITICGLFFVLGYVEGKRQGIAIAGKTSSQAAEPQAADLESSPDSRPAAKAGEEPTAPGVVREQLDWYKNLNKRGGDDLKLVGPPPSRHASGRAAPVAEGTVPDRPAPPGVLAGGSVKITYSVQVGAFRKREDAEARAVTLKTKGYKYTIEPPKEPGFFYLIKVGKYNSRAEAVATQLQLKKDGFTTFIKTN